MTRCLIPLEEVPRYVADGWRVVFRCFGGWRLDGIAVVVEKSTR